MSPLPGVILTLVLAGCNSVQFLPADSTTTSANRVDTVNQNTSIEANLNQHTTLCGIAQNAYLGAVIMRDDIPVYVNGIQEWDGSIVGKEVVVEGMLRRKNLAPRAIMNPNHEVSHGIDGQSYVLENPTWKAGHPC